MKEEKPRPYARNLPLRLTRNLRFILRARDTESLFNARATRRVLRSKNIDLEAMLRQGLYRHVKPAPKRLGYKVDPDAVMRMRKLRKRGLSYERIGASSASRQPPSANTSRKSDQIGVER